MHNEIFNPFLYVDIHINCKLFVIKNQLIFLKNIKVYIE